MTIGASSCAQVPTASTIDPHLEKIRSEARPIRPREQFTESERAYLVHYGLDISEAAVHRFGYHDCEKFDVALHWYEPTSPKRMVVISHGYYDHCGTWKHAIPALLAAGNSVVIYDHPGHGLSEGARASIDDFSDYVDVFETVVDDCKSRSQLPVVLAGHSMGCAVITEYLLDRQRSFQPSHAVFVAPLVRPTLWGPSKFGQSALSWAVSSVPRVLTRNSSNDEYLRFVEQDPLHHRSVPLKWTSALVDWNERASGFVPATAYPIRLIQGEKDGTVNWKFNLPFLQEKFPEATVRTFPTGRHQLLNESDSLRSEVLEELVESVANPAVS